MRRLREMAIAQALRRRADSPSIVCLRTSAVHPIALATALSIAVVTAASAQHQPEPSAAATPAASAKPVVAPPKPTAVTAKPTVVPVAHTAVPALPAADSKADKPARTRRGAASLASAAHAVEKIVVALGAQHEHSSPLHNLPAGRIPAAAPRAVRPPVRQPAAEATPPPRRPISWPAREVRVQWPSASPRTEVEWPELSAESSSLDR